MKTSTEIEQRHPLRWIRFHKLLVLLIVILVVAVFLIGARLHQESTYALKVNFQEYVPSWLPQGIRLAGKKVNIEHDKRFGTTDITLSFSFDSSPNSSFYEEKTTHELYACDKNNNGNDSCKMGTSLHGQQYQILMSHYSGNDYGQIIKLDRGGTSMTMMLRGYAEQPYSQDVISKIVDSFVPVHYHWLSGSTSEQCQCGG